MRLDGDMFVSTWDPLMALYDRVSPGGASPSSRSSRWEIALNAKAVAESVLKHASAATLQSAQQPLEIPPSCGRALLTRPCPRFILCRRIHLCRRLRLIQWLPGGHR